MTVAFFMARCERRGLPVVISPLAPSSSSFLVARPGRRTGCGAREEDDLAASPAAPALADDEDDEDEALDADLEAAAEGVSAAATAAAEDVFRSLAVSSRTISAAAAADACLSAGVGVGSADAWAGVSSGMYVDFCAARAALAGVAAAGMFWLNDMVTSSGAVGFWLTAAAADAAAAALPPPLMGLTPLVWVGWGYVMVTGAGAGVVDSTVFRF
jgi:hypothetical protein